MMSDSYIRLDIEPIVKLQCLCTDCKHNLSYIGELSCNLKHVEINAEAKCMCFETNDADKGVK